MCGVTPSLPSGFTVTLTANSSPVYGETLTVDTTNLADTDYGTLFYQWRRNGAAINGATKRSYTLTGEDIGKEITVTVSATNYSGSASSEGGVID